MSSGDATLSALRGGTALADPPVRRPARTAPAEPVAPSPAPGRSPERDVALDLVRGLGIVILVINHVHLETVLEEVTRAVLSAAEVLVMVSGVAVGMVFGRRWSTHGPRATTLVLLRRARKLYLASVAVVALVGLLTLVPGLATDVLAFSPRAPERDLYGFDGPLATARAVLTLEAGPWQFNILGFFIAAMALAPAVLWLLARGWWPVVLAGSVAVHLAGRHTGLDVLPSQSERPFGFLIWQLLFVPAMVLGFHRAAVERGVRASRGVVVTVVLAAALVLVHVRLVRALGADPLGLIDADVAAWDERHFQKGQLDPFRVATMASVTAATYLAFTRFRAPVTRAAGWLLLPLGRSSFYVFIMHVPLCLAVASVPGLAGEGVGPVGNVLVQLGCLGLLLLMVRRRFLFRWVPR